MDEGNLKISHYFLGLHFTCLHVRELNPLMYLSFGKVTLKLLEICCMQPFQYCNLYIKQELSVVAFIVLFCIAMSLYSCSDISHG